MRLKLLSSTLALFITMTIGAETAKLGEPEIKARYIFSLGQYVSWPAQVDLKEFNFCIADDVSKVIEKLNVLIKQNTIYKGLRSKLTVGDKSFSRCQIIFIPYSRTEDLHNITNQLASLPILIISETNAGLTKGAHINLIRLNTRVGFEVDAVQLKLDDLKVSSKVLRLAQRVIR